MEFRTSRIRHLALLALALGCTYASYSKVPHVYFYGDDFVSLMELEDQGAFHFIVHPVGNHMNFVRQAIFAGTFRIFGFHPEPHGWFTLGVHLLNVTLIFQVIRRLTASPELSAFGAILWGTCPFHGAALSWFSDGQAVSLTFLLIALERILARERAFARFSAKSAAACATSVVAGAASFGTGLASALASPVAIPLLLNHPRRQRWLLLAAALLPVVVLLIYFGSRRFYAAYFHEPPMVQQAAMLRFALADLRPAVMAVSFFAGVGVSGLLRGIAAADPADFRHVEWGLVSGYAGLVSVALARSNGASRRRMLGLAVLACAPYALIAIPRANIANFFGILPKDLAADFRYQYAASMPFAVLAPLALKHAFGNWQSVWLPRLTLGSLLALFIHSYPQRASTLDTHDECRDYVAAVVRDLNQRVDAAPVGSTVFVPNEPPPGYCSGLGLMYPGLPGTAAFFVMTHPRNVIRNRTLRFVEPKEPEGWARQFTHPRYKRLSVLLVPEASPPPTNRTR